MTKDTNIKLTDIGLPKESIYKLQSVFQQYVAMQKVWLYGSRALGTYKPASDIDLCIEGQELTLTELFAIDSAIDELLLPWKVDLSLKHQIDNSALLKHIHEFGRLFYCSPNKN